MKINKVCVIGSGVMGSSIAALIASAKVPVLLLDLKIDSSVKDKMTAGKMPQIAHPSLLSVLEIGTIDESLEQIKSCDWVIEVIVEKPEIKAELYKKISPFIKSSAIVSSNTSTLPMQQLRGYFPQELQPNFLLTHFFNPPRYMQLLEIIYDEQASKDAVKTVSSFLEDKLGKIIVKSNDTPGFIANRIGCFLLQVCLKEAYENKIPITIIDQFFAKYLGFPSTSIFGLMDLIGLDVIWLISDVLVSSLDKADKFHNVYKKYDFYQKMLDDGYKGRKGLGGFYRINNKAKEVLNFADMNYETAPKTEIEADIELFFQQSKYGPGLKRITDAFFSYVDSLLGVVSSSKEDIDLAMKLGYSWKLGPFEMQAKLKGEGRVVQSAAKPSYIMENAGASLYEHKPKNLILSFKTKMNTLNHDVFSMIIESVAYAEKYDAEKLIIYNEGRHFSAGADLKLFVEMAKKDEMQKVDEFLALGQKAFMAIKYSKVPVIACAKGSALGGGCELLLHAHAVVAHLDLSAGLVEVGVGLIPGWGGFKEMVLRSNGDKDKLEKNISRIINQYKTTSGYFFFDDFSVQSGHIVMSEHQLLEYALSNKFEAIKPKEMPPEYNFDIIFDLKDTDLDEHTILIAKKLQEAINSVTVTEESLLNMERAIFKELLTLDTTIAKMLSVVG